MTKVKKNSKTKISRAHAKKAALARVKMRKKVKKVRRRTRKITKPMMREAIKDCWGIKTAVAERCGCTLKHVVDVLRRPDWKDLLELFEQERHRLVDKAETVIVDTFEEGRAKAEPAVASRNARFVLERLGKDRGYGKEETLVLEGGSVPIGIASNVSIDSLNLTLAEKRRLLEALEAKENEDVSRR